MLQYHCLSPSTATKLVVGSSKAEIKTCLDEDSRTHTFMVFNIKPTIARQFQAKDNKTAKELGEAMRKRYHGIDHAQMIVLRLD